MSELRKAAEMVLEALARADKISGYPNNKKAITALRQALEQPERERQGLTDEELIEIYNKNYDDYVSENIGIVDFLMIAGAVEATLEDKNRG